MGKMAGERENKLREMVRGPRNGPESTDEKVGPKMREMLLLVLIRQHSTFKHEENTLG